MVRNSLNPRGLSTPSGAVAPGARKWLKLRGIARRRENAAKLWTPRDQGPDPVSKEPGSRRSLGAKESGHARTCPVVIKQC